MWEPLEDTSKVNSVYGIESIKGFSYIPIKNLMEIISRRILCVLVIFFVEVEKHACLAEGVKGMINRVNERRGQRRVILDGAVAKDSSISSFLPPIYIIDAPTYSSDQLIELNIRILTRWSAYEFLFRVILEEANYDLSFLCDLH